MNATPPNTAAGHERRSVRSRNAMPSPAARSFRSAVHSSDVQKSMTYASPFAG